MYNHYQPIYHSTRSNIIPSQQNQNFDADITRSHPSTNLISKSILKISEPITNPCTSTQRSQISTNSIY